MEIIKLSQTDSTNLFSHKLLINDEIKENTVIYTRTQTNGRGMGTNIWHSQADKNLLFSLVFFPDIKAVQHFSLSMIISLAISDYLILKGVEAIIKWPNDIVYENKKIAGILIENSILGDTIKSCIVGVGLNLNQIDFPVELSNPISLQNLTSITYDIDNEILIISDIIISVYERLKNKSFDEIRLMYLKRLYKFGQKSLYKTGDITFEATIKNVDNDGYLIMDCDGFEQRFYFKEIDFTF